MRHEVKFILQSYFRGLIIHISYGYLKVDELYMYIWVFSHKRFSHLNTVGVKNNVLVFTSCAIVLWCIVLMVQPFFNPLNAVSVYRRPRN